MNPDRVNAQDRKKEYLAKARDAERQAAHAVDHDQRENWLLIARSYRNLAQRSEQNVFFDLRVGPWHH
jgi:hypothetical protein